MKLSKEQILDLWKVRLKALSGRKPRWIYESLCFLAAFLLLPCILLSFERERILWLIFGYGIYLVLVIIVLIALSVIQKRWFLYAYPYQSRMLLYAIQDLASMGLFAAILFDVGVIFIQKNLGWNDSLQEEIFAACVIFIVVVLLLSPWLLVQKIKLASRQEKLNNYLPTALAFIAAAPGLGLIIAVTISRTSVGSFLSILLAFSLSFVFGLFTITGLYEVIFLGFHRWPTVHKSKSGFEVTEKIP